LKFTEEYRRYGSNRIRQNSSVEGILEISNDSGTFSIGKRVANDEPLNRADPNGENTGYKRRHAISPMGIT